MKRSDPPWSNPSGIKLTALCLYNSITRQKETFVPEKEVVSWYSCGPTTYDESHMGHARAYVSIDIQRRVLQNYFGYNVHYVMNITDIDDKIIKRARTTFLLREYKKKVSSINSLLDDILQAFHHHETLIKKTEDLAKRKMLTEEIERAKNAINDVHSLKSSDNLEVSLELSQSKLLNASESVLGEWLDFTMGMTVNDNTIFEALPRFYENEFNADMALLNVMPADIVTRVSEYVPQIVAFVERIVQNGYGYESNGSVYFDVANFNEHDDHYYAKLNPDGYGNSAALEEGEGALSTSSPSDKKSACDFALWKKSKEGEPSWESPWGKGRPGWHIECSAMAGAIFGDKLDIHTGGEDLKFPHHDNEMAQSEAHYGCKQWVNYFLHTGHLHIEGCKMSKSLKNFITIKKALETHTPNQIRMAFLLHQWKDTLDYSNNTMEGSKQFLKLLSEFSLSLDDLVRRCGTNVTLWDDSAKSLTESYHKSRSSIHKAMCDNIDTPGTMKEIRELISDANRYINSGSVAFNTQVLLNIKKYVFNLMNIFGLELEKSTEKSEASSKVVELAAAIGDIREQLRILSKCKDIEGNDLQRSQLELCDKIRDEMLPPIGIRLEDRDQGAPTIKIVDPEEYMKEIAEKKVQDEEKRLEREKQKTAAAAKKATEAAKEVAEPSQLYKTSEYTAWDENGIPTLNKQGKELTKSQLKKLTKGMEAHKKKYDKWILLQRGQS